MPECQAKFCTVVRGKGISTFSIPDPKKNYELCARWIHNLGNAKLNPKTFVFSKEKIVCERHFKKDCFKEDMRAKIMGYTPKRKQLKEDAVPTIFDDSKPKKIRETSSKRSEKREKQELISSLLETNKNTEPVDQPGPSTVNKTDVPINHRKRKPPEKIKSSKKIKLNEDMKNEKSTPIHSEDKSTLCNIQIEIPNHCPACVLRSNPMISISDHVYSKAPSKPDPPLTSTPMKKPISDSFHDSLETVSPVHEIDDSFHFSEISFESPDSSPSASFSNPQTAENNLPKDTVNESKFMVFSSCLDVLFKMIVCQICHSPFDFDDVRKIVDGSALKVSFTCLNNHSYSWKSQPFIGKQPVGNILLTAATYASGNTFSSISSFSSTLGLNFICKSVFYDIGNKFVLPAIDTFYNEQKTVLHERLKNKQLTVIGDGRCDSPGFCAKYCTYTIMEAVSSAILDFKVIQVTETGSSSRMELEGFKRSFTSLIDNNINIKIFCSDRHVQIRKYIKDHLPHISHQFDVWHLANSIRKKLVAIAKKKENEELMPWVRSIVNHVWYCAAECRGDSDLLIEMWTSILHHIQNVHSFNGEKYFQCGHPPLSPEQSRKKKWIQRKSKAYKALEKIVTDKRIQNDLKQLNHFCHTGEIEVYHSMMLKYVPKRQEFQYPQMVARTQLAVLDHNFNLNRGIKIDKNGQEVYAPQCSKATGRWTVKSRYEKKIIPLEKNCLKLHWRIKYQKIYL